MGLFRKKQGYLGVDLGSTSIKLVELKNERGIPTLQTYGYAERAMGDIVRGNPEEVQKKAADLLKKLYKKTGAKSYQVVTALPNFAVFNSVITLPVMSKKDLASAVKWEAKKFIPLPLEKVVLDWKIIEEIKQKKGAVILPQKTPQLENRNNQKDPPKRIYKILLTAASRELIKRYVNIFSLADLQLVSLETEAFALSRALVGKEETTTMIIDSSAVSTDIMIIEKGVPVLNRSIDVGGVNLTKTIAEHLNIDFKKAEQIKRDIGLSKTSKIPEIIIKEFQPIVEEINYSLNAYQTQTGKMVEKVILSGGSAYLPNLTSYISNIVKTKVFIGNPWARIAYPIDLKPALEEIAPRFAVAIGLALREM